MPDLPTTRRHLLFVDDEPLILQGLRRSLHHLRREWDMQFAESGRQALEMMTKTLFNVVVADMRMPGMTGLELLNEVMKRHPETVRIVLSGQADQDLLLRSVGTMHQFLSKPCEPAELEALLTKTTAIDRSLHSGRLASLVTRMQRVPSIPAIYMRIVEMLRDPEVGLEEVGAEITRDLGTTAGVLKVVNSAYFGLRQHISDPVDAVRYLGLDVLKSLVLALGAFAQFREQKIEGFSLSTVWHHSLSSAALTREIARHEAADAKTRDECFVAGLLHDAGKLVLAENFPDDYARAIQMAREERIEWHFAEQRVFGADHAQVGGGLFGLWGLPAAVVEAIALHHAPGEAGSESFRPVLAVHAADALLHEDAESEADSIPCTVDLASFERAGLLARWEAWHDLLQNQEQGTTTA